MSLFSDITVRDIIIPNEILTGINTTLNSTISCVTECAKASYAYKNGKEIGAQSCLFAAYVGIESQQVGNRIDSYTDAQIFDHNLCYTKLGFMAGTSYDRMQCFCG